MSKWTVYSNRYKEKHPDRVKNQYYKREYGITLEQYNEMFTNQNGCCKTCNRHQSEFKQRLVVDHCHKTDKIRGLLCHPCNHALGNVRDNIEILNNLIEYLKENSNV